MGEKLHSLKEGFSRNVKKIRKEKGFTQKGFVEKYGEEFMPITIETVRNWEQGRNIPEIETLDNLCKFYHCDMDYLFGRMDYKTHEHRYICETTGLSEKAVEVLELIKKYNGDGLHYGAYAFGANTKKEIRGTGKTIRAINELLENEYERFIVNKKRGMMDNLFAAIDEYMHPLDFEFVIYEENKIVIGKKSEPAVRDLISNTVQPIDEREIYRQIVLNRINIMLAKGKYDME